MSLTFLFLIKLSQRLMSKLTHAKLGVQLCLLEYGLYKRVYTGRVTKCSECSSNTWRFSPRLNQVQTQLDPEAENKYQIIIIFIMQKTLCQTCEKWLLFQRG